MMKIREGGKHVLVAVLVVLLATPPGGWAQGPPAAPQPPGGAQAAAKYKPEELEQIVAPIALYPDPLLAQVFMASTYPLEVVQAARFAKQNANLKGDQLNAALKPQTWDDSVKSLVSFPPVLTMMNEKLDWTQKLGDAFLANQKSVMDAVQRLRAKAMTAGNLQTTKEQRVVVDVQPAPGAPPSQPATQVIMIEPANPQVVYVPTSNPAVVYGAWPYPAYPPPPPYYPPGYAAGAAAVSFTAGMVTGAALYGQTNWNTGTATVNVSNYQSYSNTVNNTATANQRTQQVQSAAAQGGTQASWQHNPANRQGVPYRDQATAQQYGKGGAQQGQVASREAFRGRAEQGGQQFGQGGQGERQGAGERGGPGGQQGPGDRGGQGARGSEGGPRGGQSGGFSPGGREGFGGGHGSGGGAGGFQGMDQGRQAQQHSQRGQESLGQRGGGGRGRR